MKQIVFFNVLCLLLLLSGCSPYTKGEPIEQDLPPKVAFLVLDLQQDFLEPQGRLPIDQGQARELLANINRLIPFFAANGVETIYIGNEFDQSDTVANWFRNNSAIKGSAGARLVDGLSVISDTYFPKDQPDAFSNPQFDHYLREQKISRLVIAGVFGDQCVLSTVKGALNRRYEVIVVQDAIGTTDQKSLTKALATYGRMGVATLTTAQLLEKSWP